MEGAGAFDENYLCALRDRDRDAQDSLISRFFQPVKLKLGARLRSPELVQDACQETFLRVLTYFQSGKTLKDPASLPGFIHGVAHNVAMEMLRAHTRQDQIAESTPEAVDRDLSPELQLVTKERKKIVGQVLAELSARDQELFHRVLFNEEDKDAVCSELKVDRGYLRVMLHRARLRFKSALLCMDSRKGIGHGA
jgi:RNA polymerase sigma-70 factor, ECF subfamily